MSVSKVSKFENTDVPRDNGGTSNLLAVSDDASAPLNAGKIRSGRKRSRIMRSLSRRILASISTQVFSSLTRRIVFLNLAALLVLLSGILFLNQFREGLIDARVESLLTQGEIISGAIAASASVQTNTITIDPDRLLELRTGESIAPFDDDVVALISPEF